MFGTCVFYVIFIHALLFQYVFSQEECLSGGCFPATGDLLVGRENKITATSTCGLNGPSKYCILSFLDKQDKCFYCDSRRDQRNSHLPKYMVTRDPRDRLKNWWQSINGEQKVTIQVDLEAEFVFTHLIMTFKTFRPKAMYIERSWNYGRNWSDYRYFAYNCAKSFPGKPRGPQRSIDHVICEERFSKVEPSTGGEVVMKVLDPIIQQREDPYDFKVQNLLKLTNLRVHFTELHTFGDDVLGDSPEVNQKYYYALYEMVVRGSCSCYGHAEQCIPSDNTPVSANMVYGKCNCTHNTKGRNCEMCKDGYNDEPWRPAYKDQLNVCRKCNCNGHTEKCHFDPAVYQQTGNRSGGVCDDCQHNTAGRQCEQCKPLYYRDPFKNIFEPDVCKPCDCDPSGSFGGGECETVKNEEGRTVPGRCICKQNVEGRRCDTCKDGFWNLLESNPNGCASCNCNPLGTVDRGKCDQQTGVCRCKRYVQGLTCSKCLEGFWKLGSVPEGCRSCDCDVGGSVSSACDEITGDCKCKPNIMGRKCDTVRPGHYFGNLDQIKSEGENAIPGVIGTPFEITRKIPTDSEEKPYTGEGYVRIKEGSIVDFPRIKVPNTGKHEIVIRYDKETPGDWTDVRVKITREDGGPLGGQGCEDNRREAYFYPILPADKKSISMGSSNKICFVKDTAYKIQISFQKDSDSGSDGSTLVDSVVLLPDIDGLEIFKGREGNQRKQLWNNYNCKQYYLTPHASDDAPEICKKLQFSISAEINEGGLPCNCDTVGTNSSGSSDIITCKDAGGQCPCKPGVIGRRCDQCAPGHYGFGNEGCKPCGCDETGSTSLYCRDDTGQCSCKRRIKGRACNQCPPNHFGFPNCRACQCNEHSSTCDPFTGVCTNCKDNTAGPSCNLCAEGYYGDATSGTEKDCQRCQCPGGSSGNQFSNTCYETSFGKVICNNCTAGYTGDQCERCDDGYYGNPLIKGGKCKRCICNGNIDAFAAGKCDQVTGNCLKCINNAAGDQCELCKKGYYGDATKQNCTACVCHKLGTSPESIESCDKDNGQCKCLKNVIGKQCDKCKPGFYDIASGEGCKECSCDPVGSLETNCNQLDGQCKCREGFGGRTCNQCQDFSWGDPTAGTCKDCKCNYAGSKTLQCDRKTGKCNCKDNIIGDKCDMCASGTSGVMPQCDTCHACNDQWEDIVNEIEKKVKNLSKLAGNYTFDASEIAEYTKQISELSKRLDEIMRNLNDRKLTAEQIDNFRENVTNFREELLEVDRKANNLSKIVEDTSKRNTNATSVLDDLEKRFNNLEKNLKNLRDNITKIIESDIGGALNSTRDSLRRSREAQEIADEGKKTIKESKKFRKKIKREIKLGDPPFEDLDKENRGLLENISMRYDALEEKVNELNRMLCGSERDGCNATSCNNCGMSSNGTGARQLAKKALKLAEQAKEAITKKRDEAQSMLDNVKMAEEDIKEAVGVAMNAQNMSEQAKMKGEEVLTDIKDLIKAINDFLNSDFIHPNETKKLAMETLSLNISLTPEQVKDLADQIREVVTNLTDVDKILNETEKDLKTAIDLKEEALAAKQKAIAVMNRTMAIVDMLNETMRLQEDTLKDINIAREDIQNVQEKIDDIKKKADEAEKHLKMAENDTMMVEEGTSKLKQIFEENQENLENNEKKIKEAEELADRVKQSKADVEERHSNATEKLKGKQEEVEDVRERVKKLGDGAVEMFQTIINKLKIIEDLKKQYLLNQEKALDLYDQIRLLEFQGKYINKRLIEVGTCYGSCNPLTPDDFCADNFNKINEKEKAEKTQLENEINSRKNTNAIA